MTVVAESQAHERFEILSGLYGVPEVNPVEEVERNLDDLELHRHLRRLPALERLVVRRRFGLECKTLTEERLAERLNMTVEQVQWVEQRGLEMLANEYLAAGEAA